MKDIHEVLRRKQAKYAQLAKQIEMLQHIGDEDVGAVQIAVAGSQRAVRNQSSLAHSGRDSRIERGGENRA